MISSQCIDRNKDNIEIPAGFIVLRGSDLWIDDWIVPERQRIMMNIGFFFWRCVRDNFLSDERYFNFFFLLRGKIDLFLGEIWDLS